MQETIVIAVVMLGLFSLTPYIPSSSLMIDMPSHFTLQYAIGAVLLLPLAYFFKSSPYVHVALLLSLCLNLWQLKPLFFGHDNAPSGMTLKILQVNTLVLNRDTEPLRKIIHEEKPDVILASEINSSFAKMFLEITDDYPYQDVLAKDETAYGLAVLSKLPLQEVQKVTFDHPEISAQIVKIKHDGKTLDIMSVHPANPVGSIDSRNREFKEIAKWFAATKPENAILAGDFNASPYCYALKELLRDTGLKNTRDGRGPQGSWPSWLPAFSRIPIDHVLVTKNIRVKDFHVGSRTGSDHLPTITTLILD